jgi:signal peptide peptidase SppA
MKYSHIAALVYGKPWAILPETYDVIAEIASFRILGGHLTDDEIQARLAAAPQRERTDSGAGVAVLPLQGVIMPKADLMTAMSGGASLTSFMRTFRQAMADPEIGTILMDIDSPGGLVDGVPEAAAEIRASRGQGTRIVAHANTMAASAAYWIASAADELVVSPSGQVGSIGVLMQHVDDSEKDAKEGIKTTLVTAGKYKGETQHGPLTDEALAYQQDIVDEYYGMFVNDVARGRGVKASDVKAGYGQGRIVMAKGAKNEGMVDRIDTLDGTIGRYLGRGPTAVEGSGMTMAQFAEWAHDFSASGTGTVDVIVEPQPDEEAEAQSSDLASSGELELAKAKRNRSRR